LDSLLPLRGGKHEEERAWRERVGTRSGVVRWLIEIRGGKEKKGKREGRNRREFSTT